MKYKNTLPDNVSKFMPLHQQAIVTDEECYNEFKNIIQRLEQEVVDIPKSEQLPSKKMIRKRGSRFNCIQVFAHYFYGGCDWFILDKDMHNDILFCYAILNGDTQMSELGTVYLSDLTLNGRIELDFHWNKCSLAEALHQKYPDCFEEAYKLNSIEELNELSFNELMKSLASDYNNDITILCRECNITEQELLEFLDDKLDEQKDTELTEIQTFLLGLLHAAYLDIKLIREEYFKNLGILIDPKNTDQYRQEMLSKILKQ